ncbi:MAG TPA: ankyrin repeat domain-containing protein, partial [Gemmatimonadales bacterium]
IPLPPRPDIEQYRKRAKSLADAAATGDPAALHRWADEWLASLGRRLDMAGAQEEARAAEARRIARELGERKIGALTDAQLFIAHLHGFESWPRFASHLSAVAGPSPDSDFERAADAVVSGDAHALRALLARDPSLARARSSRMHGATLLHYVAANGHESYRQKTPPNAVEIARLLLAAGADPDATAHMYDLDCTTTEMLVSSSPPADAGLQVPLLEALLEHGAAPDGVEGNGSPMMTALRFHFPECARLLAARGARVDNVIAAAALGRVDLVDRMVDDGGTLHPGVALPRVPWPRLPADPRVHLGYALAYATWCGEQEAVAALLRKGVDPDGTDDDGPALSWAAGTGRMDIARLLITHGADLEKRNAYGGTVLGATTWFALQAPTAGVDYAGVVEELITLGARPDATAGLEERLEEVRRRYRDGAGNDAGIANGR